MSRSFVALVFRLGASSLVLCGLVALSFVVGTRVVGTPVSGQQASVHSGLVMVSHQMELRDVHDARDSVMDQVDVQQGFSSGTFSFQGVINDSMGAPASGPLQLTFTLLSTLPTPIDFFVVNNIVIVDENGLFETVLPLLNPAFLEGVENLEVRVSLTETSEVIAIVPVRHTPRAWFSEYAASSGFAENAAFADEAQEAAIAETADALTNDQTVSITLAQNFSPGVFGGQAPYATRLGNMVFLNGIFRNDVANPNGMIIGTLPPNMRPSSTQILAIHSNLSTTSGNAAVTITSDGTIRMFSSNYSAGFSFFLNGAYFTID